MCAFKWFLIFVDIYVTIQVLFIPKHSCTKMTWKQLDIRTFLYFFLLIGMGFSQVILVREQGLELFLAIRAWPSVVYEMPFVVMIKTSRLFEGFATDITDIRVLTGMVANVLLKVCLASERLIAVLNKNNKQTQTHKYTVVKVSCILQPVLRYWS